ncbi:MAG: alpha/beta hydrolase [Halioglobus sp.]|nr:alpha/beta hydrolase [Halioglobus sp.]
MELPSLGNCFFRQHLNPGRPTLLLLHGMVCSSGLNWFRLFPALSRHFNIIAPDLRGHGRSWRGARGFTLERAADDMAELLDLLDTGPVIAVGYSMGGAVAQYLWRRHPHHVNGMVLAASNYKARVARHEELFVLPFFALMVGVGNVAELVSHLPRGMVKRFLPRMADQLHEDEARWALDELRRTSLRIVAETGREMATHDASAWLHEIDVPTAVFCTARDRAIPPRHQLEMARLIEDSETFFYDEGHLACMDPQFGEELARVCLSVERRIERREGGA